MSVYHECFDTSHIKLREKSLILSIFLVKSYLVDLNILLSLVIFKRCVWMQDILYNVLLNTQTTAKYSMNSIIKKFET